MAIAIQHILVLVFGVLIGSFLNVLILRLPEKEDVVLEASHCPNCGRILQFYELVPIFSWLAQRGRCRGCMKPISAQYPIIEATNGLLWLLIFWKLGLSVDTLLCALVASILLAISVIDARTMEIPVELNWAIFALGCVRVVMDLSEAEEHILGLFILTMPLIIVLVVTDGQGFGGGDVKLMGTCGLFLGWQYVLFAFVIGCFSGAIIHKARMFFQGAGNRLALGPYLSAGVLITMLFGVELVELYISLMF